MKKIVDSALIENFAEYAVDGIIENEFVKNMPIISSFVGVYKTYRNFSDYILLRKLEKFLNELEGIDVTDKCEMMSKLSSEEEREIIGEKIIQLINSITDLEKARLMGITFRAYIHNKIDKEEMLRIFHVLENCFLGDINSFLQSEGAISRDDILAYSLASFGFFKFDDGFSEESSSAEGRKSLAFAPSKPYEKSKFAYTFCSVLLEKDL